VGGEPLVQLDGVAQRVLGCLATGAAAHPASGRDASCGRPCTACRQARRGGGGAAGRQGTDSLRGHEEQGCRGGQGEGRGASMMRPMGVRGRGAGADRGCTIRMRSHAPPPAHRRGRPGPRRAGQCLPAE
jgi:hypothetical protein